MQIIAKDKHETFLLLYTLGFKNIITAPNIPVQLTGYNFTLTLTSTRNVLVNNLEEIVAFKSTDTEGVFTIQPDAGKVYINFPMSMLKNNFYIGRFYLTNSKISLLLNEFQLVTSSGNANSGLVKIQLMLTEDNYELINMNRVALDPMQLKAANLDPFLGNNVLTNDGFKIMMEDGSGFITHS